MAPEAAKPAEQKHTEGQELRSDPKLIVVPNNFRAKKGTKLVNDLYVGDALGTGLQGGVYNLMDSKGEIDKARVLKCKHPHALLTKIRREWEVGRRVSSLFSPETSLPGYMATGEAVVNEKGSYQGMILERLAGKGPQKRLGEDDFHDITYVHEVLLCLFTALDIGQRTMGFHHSDLRLSNVMECLEPSEHGKNMVEAARGGHPAPITTMGRQQSAARQMVAAQLAPPDEDGHEHPGAAEHRAHARAASLDLGPAYSSAASVNLDAGAPHSDDRAGHTLPSSQARGGSGVPGLDLELCGPLGHAEMLITRKLYGTARAPRTPRTLAGLAAPVAEEKEEENQENGDGEANTAPPASPPMADAGDTNGPARGASTATQAADLADVSQHGAGNAPGPLASAPGATPFAAGAARADTASLGTPKIVAHTKSDHAQHGPPTPARHWQPGNKQADEVERLCRFRVIDFGLADFKELYAAGIVDSTSMGQYGVRRVARHRARKSALSNRLPINLDQFKLIPKVSVLERMYRYFWRHKGDIYHVLFDLYVDGRVWPKADEHEVRLLFSLVHHVTGVRLTGWFVDTAGHEEAADTLESAEVHHQRKRFLKHRRGCLHGLVLSCNALRAWFKPKNPGLTAAEALTAPFFRRQTARPVLLQ